MTQMVHSMLEDKSNYGDPERESLDDDLNTTIPIRADGWTAIRGVEAGDKRQNTGWYTLQGLKVSKPSRKGIYIRNGKLSVVK